MKKAILVAILAICAGNIHAQTTDPSPYCLPSVRQSSPGDSAYIDSVSINDSVFTNTSTIFNNSEYVYYNNLKTIELKRGANVVIMMYGVNTKADGVTVGWMDYDHDSAFDDIDEKLDYNHAPGDPWGGGLMFTIPTTADTGLTRLRIAMYDIFTGPLTACPTGSSNGPDVGEIEDYNVRIVDVLTGVNDVQQGMPVTMYPNPAKGSVYIATPTANSKDLSVNIIDLTGRVVINQPMPANNVVNIQALAPSVYQVLILEKDKVAARTKLVVQ